MPNPAKSAGDLHRTSKVYWDSKPNPNLFGIRVSPSESAGNPTESSNVCLKPSTPATCRLSAAFCTVLFKIPLKPRSWACSSRVSSRPSYSPDLELKTTWLKSRENQWEWFKFAIHFVSGHSWTGAACLWNCHSRFRACQRITPLV